MMFSTMTPLVSGRHIAMYTVMMAINAAKKRKTPHSIPLQCKQSGHRGSVIKAVTTMICYVADSALRLDLTGVKGWRAHQSMELKNWPTQQRRIQLLDPL